MRHIEHFIVGGTGSGAGGRVGDVFDPNSGAVQAKVPLGGQAELERAVAAAKAAQPAWAATNPQRRARVMFEFKRLVEDNIDELARVLSSEHGKVLADARGDVMRGLDMGITHFKFFPAMANGGPAALKAIAAPLSMARFCPTGGITEANAPGWLALDPVLCVGGSWIVPAGEPDGRAIEARARAAARLRAD